MARQHGAACRGSGLGMSKRTIIYFLNDSEVLPPNGQSRRHSHSQKDGAKSKDSVYGNLWAVASPGI